MVSGNRLWPHLPILGLALLLSGCDLRHPVVGSAKDLTRSVVQDPRVQSSFARGRENALRTSAKSQILRQNLLEQQAMWSDRSTRPGMVQLLVRGRDVAMADSRARSQLLQQNLRDQSLMWGDPAFSRPLTRLALHGRRSSIEAPATARPILQENLAEQRAALSQGDIAAGMADVSLRVSLHAMQNPQQAARMRHMTMSVLEAISRDPVERPRLLAVMSSLMEDPGMKSKLAAMMKAMMPSAAAGGSGAGDAPKAPGGQSSSGTGTSSSSARHPSPAPTAAEDRAVSGCPDASA